MTKLVVRSIAALSLASLQSNAAWTAEKAKPKAAKSAQVMQLDAEIIEGEKKIPSIFLEFDSQSPTMDSVILQRNDFNDYHGKDPHVPWRFKSATLRKGR